MLFAFEMRPQLEFKSKQTGHLSLVMHISEKSRKSKKTLIAP